MWIIASRRRTTFAAVLGGAGAPFRHDVAAWLAHLPSQPLNERDRHALLAVWREFTDALAIVDPALGDEIAARLLREPSGIPPEDRATLLVERVFYARAAAATARAALDEAQALFRRCDAALERFGCWDVWYTRAVCARRNGRFLSARWYTERALSAALRVPKEIRSYPSRLRPAHPLAGTRKVDADLAAVLGRPQRARDAYEHALIEFRAGGNTDYEARTLFAFADLCWALGRRALARRCYRDAQARAHATGDVPLESRAQRRIRLLEHGVHQSSRSFNGPGALGHTGVAQASMRLYRRLLPPLARAGPPWLGWLFEGVAQLAIWWGLKLIVVLPALLRARSLDRSLLAVIRTYSAKSSSA